jgi:alpha-tubulin suppressor-like RCC1 family protein
VITGCGGGSDDGGTPPPSGPPPQATTYTIGGTLAGLAPGASVVLQNNGASNLTVNANGAFTFTAPVNSGATYAVTVSTQPAGQTCTVTGGSGTASANVTGITVNCAANAVTYTIGGTVSGLAPGASVVLQNNAAANLTVTANGGFTFQAPVNSGSAYAVTVLTQPAGQNCSVANGSGTATANVTGIAVTCSTNDTTAPTISSHTPLPRATGAAVTGGVVTVTFSEAMDPASLTTTTLTLTGPGGAVAGTVALEASNTRAVFTPAARLNFDADYTATVTTGVKDAAGNALATQASWKFNTGKSLAVGLHFTCARLPDGRVKCWGDNQYGQLGYDDMLTRGNGTGPGTQGLAAVNLGAGRTAVAIAAADYHVCAILDDGSAKCWGRNEAGQLGQGVNTGASLAIGDAAGEMAALQPIDFGPGRRVLEISLGQQFTCARLDDGTLKCWGDNSRAQLGRGNLLPLGVAPGDIAAAAPVSLGTGLTPVLISLGHYHACAILEDASAARVAKCWGDNNWGQAGNGGTDRVGNTPAEMGDGLPPVNFGAGRTPTYLMATGGHSCALLDDQSTKCWGLNTWGQVGLAAGNGMLLADTEAARRTCNGGLGVGAPPLPLACIGEQPGEMGDALPAAIGAGMTTRLSIGYRHNCALRTAGGMLCWGSNEEGQLGIGSGGVLGTSASIIGDEPNEHGLQLPTLLKAARTVEELSAGGFHTCVLYTDGSINCWGYNNRGQLGRNDAELKVGDAAAEMGDALIDVNLGT